MFSAEKGYALPLVMLAVALFLVYVGESSARAVREARVARMKENAEIAQAAAEAGFNRARARLSGGGTSAEMDALDIQDQPLVHQDGTTGGHYSLQVTVLSPNDGGIYEVTSIGFFGEGKYATRREITARVRLQCPHKPAKPSPLITDYLPFEPYPYPPPDPAAPECSNL